MRNLRAEIEYDGLAYCGWQVQNSRQLSAVSYQRKSIQEIIEKSLSAILQERIHLIASGRTDAGVHALAQVVNFKTNSRIAVENLRKALNSLLPQDIKISKLLEAETGFHSRFSAKSKIYRYLILNQTHLSPFLQGKAYFYPHPLEIKLMAQAARCLIGKHDFKSFCASGSKVKTTVRSIKRITVKKTSCRLYNIGNRLVEIEIEAGGFLYNMVRNIAGTLIEVGRGRLKPGALKKVLLAKNRLLAGPTAPACGLYLVKVKY